MQGQQFFLAKLTETLPRSGDGETIWIEVTVKKAFPAAFYLNSDISVTGSTSRKEEIRI
jgi:hypothetical protein